VAGGADNYSPVAGGADNYSPASSGVDKYSPATGGADNYSPASCGAENYSLAAGGADNYSPATGRAGAIFSSTDAAITTPRVALPSFVSAPPSAPTDAASTARRVSSSFIARNMLPRRCRHTLVSQRTR